MRTAAETEAMEQTRRVLQATASFPFPSQQAWFRVRYGVAARRSRRRLLTAAGVGLAAAGAAALAAAAAAAFG